MLLFTKANSTQKSNIIRRLRLQILFFSYCLLATSVAFGQGVPGPGGVGGGVEQAPPEERVWLTNATVTYDHILETDAGLMPVASLDDVVFWLKINKYPTAPSVPWTEMWAKADTEEIDAPAPLFSRFQNGFHDDRLIFPERTEVIESTEGVEINPIVQDGNNVNDTVVAAFTYKWVKSIDPSAGRDGVETGPVISSDSVVIPYPLDEKIAHAGTWWRGASFGVLDPETREDEVFVRVAYDNFPQEAATLKLYLEHVSGVPVLQRIEPSIIFASKHHVAKGNSGGVRNWSLRIKRKDFESLDGNKYVAFVDMINKSGEVVDSIEIEIPFGEEN